MLLFGSFFSIQYDLFLLNLKLSRSFFNNFIIKPIGVTTRKKIIPIIKGETIFPKKIPNLNHILFNGVKTFEFKSPKVKKNNEIKSAHTLMLPWSNKGYAAITKKTIKKTIPKLLLEPIFTSSI